MLDITAALKRGHAKLRADKQAREKASAGHPRIGTSGCVASDGTVYGTCPRKALARGMGIEMPPELKTQIMWLAGEVNEVAWNQVMDDGLPDTLVRKDSPLIRTKVDGVPLDVLGHPDVVYGAPGDNADIEFGVDLQAVCGLPPPRDGVELKGIFGTSTAVLVALAGVPKNENLIQAAAYSHYMGGLDWALNYTNANYVTLGYHDQKAYDVKSIEPFYKTFYLEWCGPGRETLHYRSEDDDELRPTAVTRTGIDDYYRLVEEMKQREDLGPRPSSHYVCGTPNKWGRESTCKLCEFSSACDKYDGDKDYKVWVSGIKQIVEDAV